MLWRPNSDKLLCHGQQRRQQVLCVTSCGQDNLLQGSSGHCQNGYTVVCTHSTSYQPLLAGVMQ